MKTVVLTALGLLMTVAGAVWTFQGLGYLEGSAMTGERTWAQVGPIVAGLGVALLIVTFTNHRSSRGPR